jgi:hypothetical protein
MADEADVFVPVTGAVHRRMSLGVFLDLASHRIFIPANCTSTPSYRFVRGKL